MTYKQNGLSPFFHCHVNGTAYKITAFHGLSKAQAKYSAHKILTVISRRYQKVLLPISDPLSQLQTDGIKEGCLAHGLHHSAGPQYGYTSLDSQTAVKGLIRHLQGFRHTDFNGKHSLKTSFPAHTGHLFKYHLPGNRVNGSFSHFAAQTALGYPSHSHSSG